MANKIQFRRDTAANWTTANPTLSQGELGFETDTNKFKLGNGSTAWNSLGYTFNPSISADQNLNTTSNVTFATVTTPGTVTLDRIEKYGVGLANIELAEDDNLTPQTDLRSDLGISSKKFGRLYVNTATLSKVVFGDATEQNTAWTGSVSTSSVTGISTVGYTGNWVDIVGRPPVPNQYLDNTSSVGFVNLTLTGGASISTGTRANQVISAGGYPLDSNGQALVMASSTQTPAMVVSNYTAGLLPRAYIRGYGGNTPGGGASTSATPGVFMEGSRGTHSSPTAMGSGDTLGVVNFGGYDGTTWTNNQGGGLSPFTFGATASEAWVYNGTTTTNAGAQFFMRLQPPGVQLNSTSRQIFFGNNWTAGNTTTNTPPQLNVYLGQSATANNAVTPAGGVGSFGTGTGGTSFSLHSAKQFVYGVSNSDTAPDNAGITATNVVTYVTNRRSAFAGRRDPLATGDGIFFLQGNVQTAANASGNGTQVATLGFTMLETAGSTARGTQFLVQTVNTGTTTLSTKLRINDRTTNYNSDSHVFSDKNQSFTALSLTTATATFTAIPVMPVYTVATKPASGAVGQIICISDSPTTGGKTAGMMAFWDTTNSRWSYIHDNNAV